MRVPKGVGAYRLAAGVAIVATLMLVWLALGVGIIGSDGDPANLMYSGVIAVGIVGVIVARLRSVGMARTLLAMVFVQVSIIVVVLLAGLGLPWSGPAEIIGLNGLFVVLFGGSAWLFSRAVSDEPEQEAGA